MAQKIVYLCDAGPVNKPCRAETEGAYLLLGQAQHKTDPVRFDLCRYHWAQIDAALRDRIRLPRDPAEAACP